MAFRDYFLVVARKVYYSGPGFNHSSVCESDWGLFTDTVSVNGGAFDIKEAFELRSPSRDCK